MAITDDRRPARLTYLLLLCVAVTSCGFWLDDEARIDRARDALDNRHYSAAIIDLKNVLRNAPDNAMARKLLGLALAANGEPEGAEKELRKALQLGQPLDEFRVAFAEARLATGQAELALEIAVPSAAVNDLDAFLLWLYRGDAQAELGRTADALRSYAQAEELNVDKATALLRASELYWGAGNERDAMAFAESAILDDPGNIEGHLTLGAILLDMEYPQRAEETLINALTAPQLDSVDKGYILYYLSEAHLAQGDVVAARKALDQAAALWPAGDPDLHLLAGQISMAEGDNDTAAAKLLAYLVEYPESKSAMRMLGAAQLGRGMINQARLQLASVLASSPDHVETRILLARVYLEQGRFGLAREVLEPALELSPRDPNVLSLLGISNLLTNAPEPSDSPDKLVLDLLIRGEFGQALATARKTSSDQQDEPRVLELLGLCYLADGQLPAAVESFSKALAAGVDNTRYRLNLARAHLANSTFEQGLTILEGQKTANRAAEVSVIQRALLISRHKSNSALGHPDPEPLSRWLSKNPDDDGARWLLAETYMDRGLFADAAAQYELLLDQGSDDPAVHNNLAWSYLQLGDNRARVQAESAYELVPNDGVIADTLGWILVSEGDLERGPSLLRDAHILRPGEPETAYHLAYALSRTGAEDEARALLEGLLERGTDPVRESARELLAVLRRAQ